MIKLRSLITFGFALLLSTTLFCKELNVDFLDVFDSHKIPRLIINGKDGTIEMANKGAGDFYGYGQEALIGMNIKNINIMSESEVKKEWTSAVREEKNVFQFKHRLANGEIRDVEVYSYPIRIDDVDYLYSVIVDVTKRENALNSLREPQKLTIVLGSTTMFFLVFSFCIVYLYKEKYKKIADYDQLTGVYSRRCLSHLEKNKFDGNVNLSSFVMIDVNKFKEINDTKGHMTGDKVLKSVSAAIKDILRNEDLVIRYGGDEFLLVIKGVRKVEAVAIMERVVFKLKNLKEFSFPIEISYGIEESNEELTLNEIIKNADHNMYLMKKKSKGCRCADAAKEGIGGSFCH